MRGINKHKKRFSHKIIWIQELNHEGQKLIENKIGEKNVIFKKNPEEAFKEIKKINYEKTDIVIKNNSLIKDFFEILNKHISELRIIPRILILTDKEVINFNPNFLNYPLFHTNLVIKSIKTIFELLKQEDHLISGTMPLIEMKPNDKIFSFEYLDDINNLQLPLNYKKFVQKPEYGEINKFNDFLKKKTYKLPDNNEYNQSKEFVYLMEQIDRIEKIPLEIPFPLLVKYWLRIYSFETKFYSEMNSFLLVKKKEKYKIYDIYIRALYHGFDFIPFVFNETLYRGAIINSEEIKKIYNCLKKKICYCYCSAFFSCSFDENVAMFFMTRNELIQNQNYVLFIINKGTEIDKDCASNADLLPFSINKQEKEVLFYPFSSFEISNIKLLKGIKKIAIEKGNDREELSQEIEYYEIELNYLGKYKKKIPPKLYKIQETNFAKAILSTEIFNKEELIDKPEMFDFDIKKYVNYIIATYTIPKEKINKNIKLFSKNLDKDSCDIYINGNLIDFQNEYKFSEEKEYKITFKFLKSLTSTANLFEECECLTSINLSFLEICNLKIMTNMFQRCKKLETIDFNNSYPNNIQSMNGMFSECSNLKSINLSNLNAEKVIDIEGMFRNCTSLKSSILFKNSSIQSMNYLFYNCKSLTFLDLSQLDGNEAGPIGQIFGGSFNTKCKIEFKKNGNLDLKKSLFF